MAIDKLDVLWALSIAVASSELGSSFVCGESGHTTVCVHLNKVKSAVQTTGKSRHVDIESELLVLELEDLVGALILHEVRARADVGRSVAVRDKLEGERVSRGSDTVGALVVSTIERTVRSAGDVVGA